MSLRDNLRKMTIGAKTEYKTIEHKYQGETFIFKQPSLKQRSDIIMLSRDGNEVDSVALQVWTVIKLTHDVNGEAIFEDSDFDTLSNQPAGSFVDEFAEKAMKLLGNEELGNEKPAS